MAAQLDRLERKNMATGLVSSEVEVGDFLLANPSTVAEAVSELIDGIGASERCIVWRGQSNSSWKPIPGLYRRLQKAGYKDREINEDLVLQYEDDLLCEANGLGYYHQAGGNRLDLMVNLQHMGGATRLLDVTRDPFIALWFAVNENDDTGGIVYRYEIAHSCYAETESIDNWSSVINPDLAGRPLLFKPKRINERIKAQSALFLTTVLAGTLSEPSIFTNTTPLIDVKPVLISRELKRGLRDYLRRSRGLRAVDLFPDFQGFAQANSANAAFPRSQTELYSSDEDGLFPSQYQPGE